ncbi:aspartyl-tRNA synthetase [Ascodesmis nigricans]|uniref:Aspartate--tRNA ligase, cytoplasmic n=1 Tax=Ascodesmis nigricans TaxID=341454 RepID=A0A4S2N589_9PEZI|nr:aspartyl-tRNA synthetase [Ascodesmis nigricans]
MSSPQPPTEATTNLSIKDEKPDGVIPLDAEGKPLSKSALKKLAKEKEKAEKAAKRKEEEERAKAAREAANVDHATENYGPQQMNQSQTRPNLNYTWLANISAANDGEDIIFRARLENTRAQGAKMCFVVLRQGMDSVQGLLAVSADGKVSKQMVKWAASLSSESIVLVHGRVAKVTEEIKSATIGDAEIHISKLYLLSEAPEKLPMLYEDANRPAKVVEESEGKFATVSLATRLDNRTIDLRTLANQAIFRISSAVGMLFREYLFNLDFVEFHTPKLIAAASEGGANVFKVTYFNRDAFLAQSPQLYKQMLVVGGFERVMEIGPVFRAENSQTHRHMTEFTGLDMEMAFNEHYHEVMEILAGMLIHVFQGLRTKFKKEIDIVRQQFPIEEFKFPNNPKDVVVVKFKDGVKMLHEAGHTEVSPTEDLSTEMERTLGKLVLEKYDTDFYILDKFPSSVRPFYTMPDPEDPTYSNSYDFMMRGEEILSGAQRVHDANFLSEQMKKFGVDPEQPGLGDYVQSFRNGAPPHAGGGIGLERVVFLFLGLGNIRRASAFPRDPIRLRP